MPTGESLIGTVLADRYRIESTLGSGGMGVVFRARRVEDDALVAVKLLPPGDERSSLLPRFLREARLAARIKHPHVVRIYDSGRWGEKRDRYYLAMELVQGLPLDELLDADFSTGACVRLADQILDALAHVHARGILHRDIKPENVIVKREEDGSLELKVLDFGIASAFGDEEATRLTQEGASLGTPAYMAPEQAQGRTLEGPVTDLYPVGVILYRLLSGHLPFEGSLTAVLLSKIQSDPAPLEARSGLEVPAELVEIVSHLVARQPEDRFQMAPDVREALAPFLGSAQMEASRWRTLRGVDPTPVDGGETHPSVSGDETLLPEQSDAVVMDTATMAADQLWGREEERRCLESIAAKVEAGEGQVALLGGPTGIGKSELAKSVGISMAESGRFFVLHAGYDRGGGRQAGVIAALEGCLGTAGASRAGVKSKVEEFLRRYGEQDADEIEELVEFLRPRAATGEGPSADRRERRFAVFVRVLRQMAKSRPLMLVLDDLDAGGADAAAFVSFVLFEVGFEAFPLFLLATYRSLHDPIFARALGQSDRYEGTSRQTLALGPIEDTAMSEWLVQGQGLSPDLAAVVVRRAGGNPLFAEHLANAGQGAFSTHTLAASNTQGEVPIALRSLLERSLEERLAGSAQADELREVLTHLAVLGLRAPATFLEASLDAESSRHLDDWLDELLGLEILEEVRGRDDQVGFTQALLRDVVLAGVGARRLRRMQRDAARIRADAPSAIDDADAIGDHWEAAGDTDKAIEWWLQAIDRQILVGQAMSGAASGMKAYAALSDEDPQRASLGIRLGRLLLDMGQLDQAEAVLSPLLKGADADMAMFAGAVLADLRESRGAGAAFGELISAMEARVPEASDEGKGAFHSAKALALNYEGDYKLAFEHAALAAKLSREGEPRQRAKLRLAMVHALLGAPAVGIEIAQAVVDEAAGASDVLARALRGLGFLYFHGGRPKAAKEIHERALEVARRTGRAARVPITIHDLSVCHAALGDLEQASASARDAVRAAEELGLENIVVFSELKLITFQLLQGDASQTLARMDELVRRGRAAGMHMLETLVEPVTGWALAVDGQHAAAVSHLAAIETLEAYPRIFEVGQIFQGIGEALLVMTTEGTHDHRAHARQYFEHAHRIWDATAWNARRDHCQRRLDELAAGHAAD